MIKIVININGTDHEITREDAVRIHAELSADLGLALPPLGPAPYPQTVPSPWPDHKQWPGLQFPLTPQCVPGDPIWLVDPRSLPTYQVPPTTVTSDSLVPSVPAPPAPSMPRPAPDFVVEGATPATRTEHGFVPERPVIPNTMKKVLVPEGATNPPVH